MNTQHPTRDADPERLSGAEGFLSFCAHKRISANPFGMNTYEKTGGGGGAGTFTRPSSRSLFCSFLHSFAMHGNSSSYFSTASALFTQNTRVYPNSSSPRELLRGANTELAPPLFAHSSTNLHGLCCTPLGLSPCLFTSL